VSFFEEHGADLKELFFESAQELLQTMNEEGMRLEQSPQDEEIVRSLRRAVHTLKGDSAVCGYAEISELAHQMEDVLTLEMARSGNASMAELVLSAADLFGAMLAAYRNNTPLPQADALRAAIRRMTGGDDAADANDRKKNGSKGEKIASSPWTEYQQLVIDKAAAEGKKILLVIVAIDDLCPMRAAAMQLVRNVLEEAGTLLAIQPEDTSAKNISIVQAAVATNADIDWLVRKCQIPAVVSDIDVRPYQAPGSSPQPKGKSPATPNALAHTPAPPAAPPQPRSAPTAPAAQAPAPPPAAKAPAGPQKASREPEAATAREAAVQQTAGATTASGSDSILRVDVERIDALMNLVGELIVSKSMMHQNMVDFEQRYRKDPLQARFTDALALQSRVLTEMQKAVMKIRMVPVEQLFRRFPRLVRDVAKARGREVRLEISGEDTELDKSILDVIAEPLTHLLRNAVDHGIESPSERRAHGKPEHGTLKLRAYHQGNQMVIEVSDDGRGIDRNKVLARAIESNIISREEAIQLSDRDALDLIFHPGLSTAETVTTISGRGVGMDVVKTVLEKLKGSVHIDTRAGAGTTFYLKVPLTLAIIKALLFYANERLYALPLNSVIEITRAYESEFHRVDHREVLKLREHVITLVHLGKLDGKPRSSSPKKFVVVVSFNGSLFGLVVDKLMGEQELVIKGLDDHWVATELVSGASILGDGTVVLVLNMAAVITRLGRKAEAHQGRKGATA
jgi:two-component system chemotaxis sensor kinase CheA